MSTSPFESHEEITGTSVFTIRSVVLGAIMAFVIGIVGPYWTFYLGSSYLFLDYSVGGAMFFLFLLVLVVNGFLALLWRGIALRAGEMVVVTVMMLVSGSITTMGLTGYLVPNMTTPYYLATAENKWEEELWPHLPEWAAPLDTHEGPIKDRLTAIRIFEKGLEEKSPILVESWWSFRGAKTSWQNFVKVTKSMPWGPWWHPLMWWGIFLMALYAAMVCVMTIARKQWIEYERLTFPIAQVPQELCATAADPWGTTSMFRNWLFWAGFAVPCVMGTLTALRTFYPGTPTVPISIIVRDIGPLELQLYFSCAVLGFTFLIPNKVAFSVWFLNIASFIFRSILKKYDLEMESNNWLYGAAGYPIMGHQGMGAMLVFTLASIYFSRQHLRRAALCALGPNKLAAVLYCLGSVVWLVGTFMLASLIFESAAAAMVTVMLWGLLTALLSWTLARARSGAGATEKAYDEGEPSSYRMAFVILFVSVVVMVAWLAKAGLPPLFGCIFLFASVLIFYGITRVVAQCGVSVTIAPMTAPGFMITTFGGANIVAKGIGTLTQSWTWMSDIRTTVMGGAAHGMYLARKKGRGLLVVMLLAAFITMAVATLATIWLGYWVGAANFNDWFFISGPKFTFNWGVREIAEVQQPQAAAFVWMGVGAAIMGVLTVAHRALYWWPIHPVGFIICSVYWTDMLWGTILLAWLIKLIVMKIGGNRVLRKARWFFLGMILGQFSIAGIWAVFDMITGTMNHRILWI